jgi:hypothetical protein
LFDLQSNLALVDIFIDGTQIGIDVITGGGDFLPGQQFFVGFFDDLLNLVFCLLPFNEAFNYFAKDIVSVTQQVLSAVSDGA